MRATRALVGAFGAGISLAVAASVALMVVSSVIAFRGWPGEASEFQPEIARLSKAAARPVTTTAPVVSLPHARGAEPVRTATATRGLAVTPPRSAGPLVASTEPITASAGPPTSVVTQPAPKAAAPVHQAAGAVGDTADAVSQVVAPASPGAASALQAVGAAGAQLVDTLGRAVGDLLPGS